LRNHIFFQSGLIFAIHCNYVNLYAVQLLDAVMKLIEPTGRFHRSEVSLACVCVFMKAQLWSTMTF